jgi:6-phosphogluconolactonase
MRRLFKSGVSATLLAVFVVLAGCATSPSEPGGTFAYVSNSESKEIYVMRMDKNNGDLTVVQKVPLKAGGPSTPMAISPDRKFLYAAIRTEPFTVSTFAIEQYGMLRQVGEAPLANSMAYLSTDRTGRYLFSASFGGHMISVNPIGPDGIPKAPHQTLAAEQNAHAIVADPSNQFVFVPCLGFDTVMQWRFDAAAGKLTPNEPRLRMVREKAGPRHFIFHPNGKYAYLLNELDGSVYVFTLDDKAGTLALHQVTSAVPAGHTGKVWAADIHITPNGKFLYTSERTSSTITSFKVGADGILSKIESVPTQTQPRGFNIDPSGRYLLAVGQLSHGLTSYAINGETGKLYKQKDYPVGKNPNWVEIISLP